jgi:hypothetical protein
MPLLLLLLQVTSARQSMPLPRRCCCLQTTSARPSMPLLLLLLLLLLRIININHLCQAVYVECVVPLQLAQLVQLRNGHVPRGGLAVLGLAVYLRKELLRHEQQEGQNKHGMEGVLMCSGLTACCKAERGYSCCCWC